MTVSLAGRCAVTGTMGGVVTTSSPAVGARCLFTRAGVGVVLTQFWTGPRLGPRGISLLAEGLPAARVRDAVIDATGAGAHFTGAHNKPAPGAAIGPDCVAIGPDCVAIGNILRIDADPKPLTALRRMWDTYAPRADTSEGRAMTPDRLATP